MSKIQFWKDSYSICPSCQKTNIKEDKQCQDCRHNGDAYGTTYFTCVDCGWSTSFLYDEADTPYFYETRNYGKIDETPYVPTPDKQIGAYIKSKYNQLRLYASNETMYTVMNNDRYAIHIIRDFLDESPATVTETPARVQLSELDENVKWIAQRLQSADIVVSIKRSPSIADGEPTSNSSTKSPHNNKKATPPQRRVQTHQQKPKPGAIWR